MGYITNALMVGIGFVGLRMLGQGSLSMVSHYIINQWWVSRRGMVMGIAGVSGALISCVLPLDYGNRLQPLVRVSWCCQSF